MKVQIDPGCCQGHGRCYDLAPGLFLQDDLRRRCSIAHAGRFGGAWLPTRYEDVAAIAYDTEHSSSRPIIRATSGRRGTWRR